VNLRVYCETARFERSGCGFAEELYFQWKDSEEGLKTD
jgi:hypothetical protein